MLLIACLYLYNEQFYRFLFLQTASQVKKITYNKTGAVYCSTFVHLTQCVNLMSKQS